MSINEIIPLDQLFSGNIVNSKKKRKKIDHAALASPLMRIPKMDILVARDLIDIGINELYEIQGRSAESLFEEIEKIRSATPIYRLSYLRMAVYFAENENADPKMLHPSMWTD